MSKNYDNWERLVTSVVRRERDRQIALSHSRDNSSTSSTFSSISQFDRHHHDSQALDYSDFTLDHADWKTMLPAPPDKPELVWRSASLRFFLDPTTGNNCFLLGVARLIMSWGDGFNDCWETKFHPKSRFSEVAELIDSPKFYIEGNVKTKMLSPETSYDAYLVFGVSDRYEKLHSAVSIIRSCNDHESGYGHHEEQARIVQFQPGNGRADGWLEIQLGDFYVGLESKGEVQVQLLDTSRYRKRGLVVEGLEFRPSM
ncbi:hypothetical protein C2S51_022001 [Perilla frutescens var. frutescens]|nr:hypothetical protein C2S51_022001 [Perilla frutescens var. frutescens]